MVALITELNNNNYQEVTNKGLVLVDIWADWCAPCKMVAPIVDELSIEYQGRVTVGKLDADTNKEILVPLSVRNIPTLLLYKNGEIVDKCVGAATKQKLSEMINKHL